MLMHHLVLHRVGGAQVPGMAKPRLITLSSSYVHLMLDKFAFVLSLYSAYRLTPVMATRLERTSHIQHLCAFVEATFHTAALHSQTRREKTTN